jgi:hypothetical protein
MSQTFEQKLLNCTKRIVEIEDEFRDVMMGQYIFLEVLRIVESNERLSSMGSHFFTYLERSFIESLVLAVRRQSDRTKKVRSLHKLLIHIAEPPLVITRDHFMSFWKQRSKDGQRAFDEFVGEGKSQLDRKQILSDVELLESKSKLITNYATQHIAHYGNEPLQVYPGMTDLLEALSCIYKLIRKYFTLLTGIIMGEFSPNFMYDWKAIFTFPWIETTSER